MDDSTALELRRLQQENEALKKQLEESQKLADNMSRESFFVDLMGNHRITPEEYQNALQEFHLDFPTERFVVMRIEINPDLITQMDSNLADNQESLRFARFVVRNVTEDLLGKKNRCQVVLVNGELVALINVLEDPETAMASLQAAAEEASRTFELHYDSLVTYTVSNIHEGYRSISAAYQEAQSLVQYRCMVGEDARVMVYDQHTEQNFPKERVEHFEFEHQLGNCMRTGDYEAARNLVHRMLNAEFNHTRPSIQIFMIRAYGIINDLLHVLDGLEESFSIDFLMELQAGPRIVNAASIADISREMDYIFDAIIAQQQTREEEPAWIQRVIDYMDDNFTDPNLNVTSVAEAMDINPVYLSRMLKKCRNIRPLEYIHQKRIEKAKLLLGQGVTVKDTLSLVGYSSALTMNRAFRKFENTTPGTFYREKQ
ncbi:MAG: AraC family transcriptional regulator [Oscillospiraceae bacterium]|nr:AraC family transcriptional regulator [Oscillospiraceae bacterium]